jgi:6,7-dimethyl-8-ribityllumazine synthase
MSKIYKGNLIAEGKSFGIIVSRFNEFISGKLLEGAIDCILRHGGKEDKIEIFWTPGSFEIPLTAQKLCEKKKYDAIICLGAIIRGETPHFEYVANETSKGVAQTGLKYGIPIAFGIITADNIEQAIERAGTKSGNKGWDAALTAIEMCNLFEEI